MDDVERVDVDERLTDLEADRDRIDPRQAYLLIDQRGQRAAVDQFHHLEVHAAVEAAVVDLDHVGMVDLGLLGKVRGSPYVGVSAFSCNPKLRTLSAIMRMSIGMLQRAIRKSTGKYGKNVAILTHSGASAAKVSAALNAEPKPVRHKLSFDEAEAMLTARFAAFLLEPKRDTDRLLDLATALELLSSAKRANGLAVANQWQVWALAVQAGKVPRAKFVQSLLSVMDDLRNQGFSGDPGKDWTGIKRALRQVGDAELTNVAKNLDYLVAFNRGKRISGGLGAVWVRDGQYTGARAALDLALAQDQILGGVDDPPGVQVMNVHRAKGKQFDGVIVVREARHDGQTMVTGRCVRPRLHSTGFAKRRLWVRAQRLMC